ncbi:MAG: ATP-dependent DNA helicase, partial [Betaproteobacteria bacterium]
MIDPASQSLAEAVPADRVATEVYTGNTADATGSAPFTVSVRNLCAFAAKCGDLDLRFTPSPTALQGRLGHQRVAQRRGPGYESEVSLEGVVRGLRVRGRADGFDPDSHTLDEVKTFRGAVEAIAPHHQLLHWAQAKAYGALICASRGLTVLTLRLVYFDVLAQTEHPFTQRCSAAQLQQFLDDLCGRFVDWACQEQAHRADRDAALAGLAFPQLPFRPGQRNLASAVYRACLQSRPLLAQAPTGIGKTIGTLFPALRAMPVRGTDKVFFLTARTPGRQVALDALRALRASRGTPGPGAGVLPLRVLELVAKEKSCEHPDKACHPDSCPLARGFYDRLPAARQNAVRHGWLDQQALRRLALAQAICPYYLGHEMLRWSDVVVADYNYYFDRSAMLHAMTLDNQWRVTVLVDEAHNLVPRARSMYSSDLSHAETLALRGQVPGGLRARVDELLGQWQLLHDAQLRVAPEQTWVQLDAVPEAWQRALQKLCSALGEHVNDRPLDTDSVVLAFYFRALAFASLAEMFGTHSLCEYDCGDGADAALAPASVQAQQQVRIADGGFDFPLDAVGRLTLRNIVPGPFLTPRIQAADAVVLFSATLNPQHYYSALLGLPDDTAWLDVPSPFAASQLQVRIVPVSTRQGDRAASLDTLVAAMAQQFARRPGNYLAYFSSFDYLQQACARMRETHPHIAVWAQARQMDEPARRVFLQRFDAAGQGIGFAVLGGVFGEGVDLPGARLIGAFVATLGLPQFDAVNEVIRARMDELFGQGYDYTYVYPGLQKVVQAAGRVIRSETDTG